MAGPLRVVSLVPSLTELVFWLGRGDWLVGRTRFCVEPAGEVERVAIIGGTKNPKVDRIVALAPDLVLANKEENRREDIAALQAAGLRILLTDPDTVEEAASMVEDVGRALDARARASQLAAETRDVLQHVPAGPGPRVFVPIWWEPLMGLGAESYGHDLLERAGATNVLRDRPRYPEITFDELRSLAPQLILLPDEPFPFKEEHAKAFRTVAPVRFIDGKLLWWYGPRMPAALRTLRETLALARG